MCRLQYDRSQLGTVVLYQSNYIYFSDVEYSTSLSCGIFCIHIESKVSWLASGYYVLLLGQQLISLLSKSLRKKLLRSHNNVRSFFQEGFWGQCVSEALEFLRHAYLLEYKYMVSRNFFLQWYEIFKSDERQCKHSPHVPKRLLPQLVCCHKHFKRHNAAQCVQIILAFEWR